MKKLVLLLIISVALCSAVTVAQVSFGDARLFNDGWRFVLADSAVFASPEYADTGWRKLNVPHDWSVEGQISPSLASCTGYLPGGTGWYRKHFTVNDTADCHYIYFEGVYNRSEVYLNGHLLGKRPNGYASFMYDMSPWLREGENVLAVRVDHSRYADSRWYTGSGIYRDVYMVSAPATHLSQWGTSYRLLKADKRRAVVEVDVAVDSLAGNEHLLIQIFDPDGKQAATESRGRLKPLNTLKINIPKPRMWNLDSPELYTLRVQLLRGAEVIDSTDVKMGLRTLEFSPDKGFALNGRNMKVKGVCLHHDAGVLGAVVPREVWERRIKSLKALGANAIRMSHNPQAPVLYELCDSLGMLVMDEASDEWEFPKRKWIEGWNRGTPGFDGTYDFFEEWIDRDVTDMVRRDRNHPSVFLWSIGNEVDYPNDPYSHPVLDGDGSAISQPMYGGFNPDAPRAERIGDIAHRLVACVKSVDTSRPTTGALAGVAMSNHTTYPQEVDITGYNYTESRYASDHAEYPERIIYGSETHTGLNPWKAVRDNDFIFGHFVWTGTDYLGESGAWPSRGLGTGLLGFGGIVKPRGHYQQALWSEEPVAWFGTFRAKGRPQWEPWDDWNYTPGEEIIVAGMSNAPKARLLLNGAEVGAVQTDDEGNCRFMWKVPFAPGRLEMEALDENGNVVARHAVNTTGRPAALAAKFADPQPGSHGGVAIVEIEVKDDEGHTVALADNMLHCRVQGDARLLGIENSDNRDMSNPRERSRRAFRGQAVAYISYKGPFSATFTSPLLEPATVEWK